MKTEVIDNSNEFKLTDATSVKHQAKDSENRSVKKAKPQKKLNSVLEVYCYRGGKLEEKRLDARKITVISLTILGAVLSIASLAAITLMASPPVLLIIAVGLLPILSAACFGGGQLGCNFYDEYRYYPDGSPSAKWLTADFLSSGTSFIKRLSNSEFIDLLNSENSFDDNTVYYVKGDVKIEGEACLLLNNRFKKNLSLPKKLVVDGSLLVSNCNLVDCSETLFIRGDLFFNCSNIDFSKNRKLCIEGHCALQNTRQHTTISKGIHVGKHLILCKCKDFNSLPESIEHLGGDLSIENCEHFNSVPNWVKELKMKHYPETGKRVVTLIRNGITEQMLHRLRFLNSTQRSFEIKRYSNCFPYSLRSTFSSNPNLSSERKSIISQLKNLVYFFGAESNPSPDRFQLNEKIINMIYRNDKSDNYDLVWTNYSLMLWLNSLKKSKEFENSSKSMAQRVIKVLGFLSDENIGVELSDIIENDEAASCCIRSVEALNRFEMVQLAHEYAIQGNENKIREIAKQIVIRDKVIKIATDYCNQKIQEGETVDKFSIHSEFLTELRKRGIVASDVSEPSYIEQSGHISKNDIDNAESIINDHCTDEVVDTFMENNWSPWAVYLRAKDTVPFEKISKCVQLPPQLPFSPIQNNASDHIVAVCSPLKNSSGAVEKDIVHYFNYESFVRSYIINGRNPMTKQPVNRENIYRVVRT